ncbi:hypothetical protein ACFX13_030176 [Malus domestica]
MLGRYSYHKTKPPFKAHKASLSLIPPWKAIHGLHLGVRPLLLQAAMATRTCGGEVNGGGGGEEEDDSEEEFVNCGR